LPLPLKRLNLRIDLGKMSDLKMEKKKERLLSLDVFRGITIAGMILVNNPGSWSNIYPALKHAEWHGLTPTDLIFPFFLFIIGVAMPYSFTKRIEAGGSKIKLAYHVIYRSAMLFFVGMILTGLPDFNYYNKLILDVLQRIGVIYFFAGIIFIYFNKRWQIMISAACLLIYWILMFTIQVPGFGAGDLSPQGNAWSFVDKVLTSGWHNHGEGILSLISSIPSVLFGAFTGYWLRGEKSQQEKVSGMFVLGFFAMLAGIILDMWFPFNKLLWSSSYVIYTTGMALSFLSVCYYIIDVKGYKKIMLPFVVFGTNAITAFFLSSLTAKLLGLIKVTTSTEPVFLTVSLKTYIYQNFFKGFFGDYHSSLFYALTYILFWFGAMNILYRKKIFVKI
jgi:predicted acyltransferase